MVSIIHAYLVPNLTNMEDTFSQTLEFLIGSIYTIHTAILILWRDSVFPSQKRVLFLHLLSGPLAIIADATQLFLIDSISIGPFLQTFKIFTIKPVKRIIFGASKVLKVLFPPFIAIVALLYIWALFSFQHLNWSIYWSSVNGSLYSWVQVLTLDDWSARLLPLLTRAG